MGVDLNLLVPISPKLDYLLGHTEISLDRQRILWDFLIDELEGKMHPITSIACHHYYDKESEHHIYGDISEDPYGSPLQYVRAHDLSVALGSFNDLYPMNKAAYAFVTALPPDYPVILYWH